MAEKLQEPYQLTILSAKLPAAPGDLVSHKIGLAFRAGREPGHAEARAVLSFAGIAHVISSSLLSNSLRRLSAGIVSGRRAAAADRVIFKLRLSERAVPSPPTPALS